MTNSYGVHYVTLLFKIICCIIYFLGFLMWTIF